MEILTILMLIWLHFVADFLAQNDKMALNKSKDVVTLIYHSVVYGMFFIGMGFQYCVLNMFLHGVVDFISSKVTTKLYKEEKRHWFFVTIGFDQAIHITTLLLTYKLMM